MSHKHKNAMHHVHTDSEVIDVHHKHDSTLPHSHRDTEATAMSSSILKKRALLRVDEDFYSSTHSLTWAGHQPHVTAHQQLEADGDEEGVILAPTGRVTSYLSLAAFSSMIGYSITHGWNTGVLNMPSEHIKNFLNSTYTDRFGSVPSDSLLNLLWSISVSIYLVGGCGGAFSAGWLANRFGRKKALMFLHGFGYVAAILFATCKVANSFEMLIIARLLVGFGCGAGSGLVPMYLTEISPVNLRGAMGVLHQLGLTIGILLSQIFGLRQVLGQEHLWPYLLAMTGVLSLISNVCLPFAPESPRFLYVNKKDDDAAEKALIKFRKEDDVSLDLNEMKQEILHAESDPEWTFKELFKAKDLQMPLALLCVMSVAQQLSGINVVFYYSNDVFLSANIPQEYIQYATLGTGVINVCMTIVSVPLMEKAGRRPLLLGGMCDMVAWSIIMTIALSFKDVAPWIPYISVVAFIGFVVGFAMGLGSIPQFAGGELFRQGPRPPAMSFAGLLNWLCNVIVGIIFPIMAPYTKQFSFLPFMVTVIGFGAFLWVKLPETKGKTYDEIGKHFSKHDSTAEAQELLDKVHSAENEQENNSSKPVANGGDVEMSVMSNSNRSVA